MCRILMQIQPSLFIILVLLTLVCLQYYNVQSLNAILVITFKDPILIIDTGYLQYYHTMSSALTRFCQCWKYSSYLQYSRKICYNIIS